MADYVDPVEIAGHQIPVRTDETIDPHQVVFVTKAAQHRAAEIEAGLAAGKYAGIESEVRAELASLRKPNVGLGIEGDPGTPALVPQWLREWRGGESLPAGQVRRDIEEFEAMRDKARRYDEIRNIVAGTLDDASKLGWIQGVVDR